MKLSRVNIPLHVRATVGEGDDQACIQCAEIESAVESIGKRGEIRGCVLCESECMVTPSEAGLELAQYGVGPPEFGQRLGLSPADDGRLMKASRRADGVKAGQPVGEHVAAGG